MPVLNQADTEDRVIGALLTIKNSVQLGSALDVLSAAMFTDIQNRYTFEAITSLYVDSKPVTLAGVCSYLAAQQLTLDSRKIYTYQSIYNDTYFLDKDIETLVTAKIVFDVKNIIPELHKFVEEPLSSDTSIYHKLNNVQAKLNAIGKENIDHGKNASEALDELIAAYSNTDSEWVATGYNDLDAIVHGFTNGSLNVIAARPGEGKTTAGLDIARSVSLHQNKPCVFFSLEMPRIQLMQKIMAAELDVELDAFITKTLTDDQKQAVEDFQKTKKELLDNLIIYDDSSLTIDQLELKIPMLVREKNAALIIVDYIQLIKTEGKRRESRSVEIQEITQRLKALAMSVNVPILGLAQLNREIESRTSGKPQLSDLRESGSIEQDAHLVIMLAREDKDDNSDKNSIKPTLFHVTKNRLGKTGVASLLSDLKHSRFLYNAYSPIKQYPPAKTPSYASHLQSVTSVKDPWLSF